VLFASRRTLGPVKGAAKFVVGAWPENASIGRRNAELEIVMRTRMRILSLSNRRLRIVAGFLREIYRFPFSHGSRFPEEEG
jgi:hypothetical protein